MNRPYVILSCAMSIDGYLDSAAPRKLAMSNAADFDRVDQLRADSDAIMVGASTVRRDDPRLLVRSDERRLRAPRRGQAELADEGDGHGERRSAAASRPSSPRGTSRSSCTARGGARAPSRSRLGDVATVVGPRRARDDGRCRSPTSPTRGVRRLMVEGGGRLHTQFLVDELVDELQLVVAPVLRRRVPRAAVRRGRPLSLDRRRIGRRSPTPAGSATSCCCATPCRTGSRPSARQPASAGGPPRALVKAGGGRRIRRCERAGAARIAGRHDRGVRDAGRGSARRGCAGGGHARRRCWVCRWSRSPWC